MSNQLIHKQNPNAGDLIDCLRQAVNYAPSMPFAIEVLIDVNGMGYMKYYPLDTSFPIMPSDNSLNLKANQAENAPFTSVECVLKGLDSLAGSDKALKVDISIPGSRPGSSKSVFHDVIRVDSNCGLSLDVKVHNLKDVK